MIQATSSLRPLTDDDLPAIVEIEQKVHIAPWTLEHFRAELEKPYSEVLVMTDDETDSQVAAYIVYWLMFEECQILNVAVDLPYRGLGLAKRMVRQVITLGSRKGVHRVTLDVRKSNLPAVNLYQSIGFVITRVQKGFYSNGDDAYQMALSLVDEKVDF
jgi:[ribosomal protein S18]-alanine N-acetyltransferase